MSYDLRISVKVDGCDRYAVIAEPLHVECEIERYVLDANGFIRLNESRTDALKVTEKIF